MVAVAPDSPLKDGRIVLAYRGSSIMVRRHYEKSRHVLFPPENQEFHLELFPKDDKPTLELWRMCKGGKA